MGRYLARNRVDVINLHPGGDFGNQFADGRRPPKTLRLPLKTLRPEIGKINLKLRKSNIAGEQEEVAHTGS